MPAYGGGLSAQFGFKAETVVGTQVVVDHFVEFLNETLQYNPTWLETAGLKAGQGYKRVTRTLVSRVSVNGDGSLECADKGLGLLWRHALGGGSGPTVIAATTAFNQYHVPGAKTGLGLTIQIGRPQTDATVRPFTYRGCKIVSWTFSVSDNAFATLAITFDGWQEDTATALATASFPATAGVFTFADVGPATGGSFTLGGTVTTTSGVTTVASGVSVATLCRGITITGATPVRGEGYGLGNNGVKSNQIENGIPTITGSLDAEFTQRTELYDLFKANTTTAIQLDMAHGDAGGANPYRLGFIIPAVKIKDANVNVGGPDVVPQQINFEGYDDGTGTNPAIQVRIVSTDTTL